MGANCDDDRSLPVYSVAGAPTNELRLSKHVYDNVLGNIYLDPLRDSNFIDTEQFQRLRELKQLGVTRMVHPGAVHSRFEHSLGVYWLAGERLKTFQGMELDIDRCDLQTVRRTGILQGPLSGTFEREFIKRNVLQNQAAVVNKGKKKLYRTRQVGQPLKRKQKPSQHSDDDSDNEEHGSQPSTKRKPKASHDDFDDYSSGSGSGSENGDPEGIMMELPDLRLLLQGLGHNLKKFGDNVLGGDRVFIPAQRIKRKMARMLLEEKRFDQVKMLTTCKTNLIFSSDGKQASIYWKCDATRYKKWKSKDSKVGEKLTDAAGYIRDQEDCEICWCFALTDLISATLVVDGLEDSYKSLSPMYLCRKVMPSKRKSYEFEGVEHVCYGHNIEDALDHIAKFGIPNKEWDGKVDCCNEGSGLGDEDENRFYVKSIFEHRTLDEALERLQTHPVIASLAGFTGWNDKQVYRGPLKNGSMLQGSHQVVMLECLVKEGELVVKCKSSNGTSLGYKGYIYVSLEVMWTEVGAIRDEEAEGDEKVLPGTCHISPQHLLSDFYSVEMSRQKEFEEEEGSESPSSSSSSH